MNFRANRKNNNAIFAVSEEKRAGKARAADNEYSINGPKADGSANSPGGAKLERVSPPDIAERDVLADCMKALKVHPRVAWVERVTTGTFKTFTGKFVKTGFPGCSDIIGQLNDGRLLAVEIKKAGERAEAHQVEFLGKVTRCGGVAFVAWSAQDIARGLGDWGEAA